MKTIKIIKNNNYNYNNNKAKKLFYFNIFIYYNIKFNI
jgi:hypothetical protein